MSGLENLRKDLTDLSKSVDGVRDSNRQEIERLNGLKFSLDALKVDLEDVKKVVNLQGEKSLEALRSDLASFAVTNSKPCAMVETVQGLQVEVKNLESRMLSEGEKNRESLSENRAAETDLGSEDRQLSLGITQLTGSIEDLGGRVTRMESQLLQEREQNQQRLSAGLEAIDARFLCTIAILRETMTANKGAFVALDRKIKDGLIKLGALDTKASPSGLPQAETSSASDLDKFCRWEEKLHAPAGQAIPE